MVQTDIYPEEALPPNNKRYNYLQILYIASVQKRRTRFILVDRKPITVREGENRIPWDLPELHTVRLVAADRTKRVSFSIRRLDPDGEWTCRIIASSDGEAVLKHVSPGTYLLDGSYGGEKRTLTIDVPAQTRIRLE